MNMDAIKELMDKAIQSDMGQGVMTLGELVARLENAQLKGAKKVAIDGPDDLLGDGEEKHPGHVDSYRGVYAHLAIEPTSTPCEIEDLIARLREADGKTFTGYKGGNFTMNRNTPIWVSRRGEASEYAVVDVVFGDYGSTAFIKVEYQ